MAVVRPPVTTNDLFALLSWDASIALFVLEKLQIGVQVTSEERRKFGRTLMFITSLMLPCAEADELGARRITEFFANLPDNDFMWLVPFADDLGKVAHRLDCPAQSEWDKDLLKRAEVGVLKLLKTLHNCRMKHYHG